MQKYENRRRIAFLCQWFFQELMIFMDMVEGGVGLHGPVSPPRDRDFPLKNRSMMLAGADKNDYFCSIEQ
ncbi:MAG TPA: hypothetical protein DD401_02780 [Prevotella sp.]|nr:hypothetical protein [Prevotella sp.]